MQFQVLFLVGRKAIAAGNAGGKSQQIDCGWRSWQLVTFILRPMKVKLETWSQGNMVTCSQLYSHDSSKSALGVLTVGVMFATINPSADMLSNTLSRHELSVHV